jgi:hypothetical protein
VVIKVAATRADCIVGTRKAWPLDHARSGSVPAVERHGEHEGVSSNMKAFLPSSPSLSSTSSFSVSGNTRSNVSWLFHTVAGVEAWRR